MSQEQTLIEEIPIGFAEAVRSRLGPGESILATLQGSHGEAFVLTDKRAFVLREQTTGSNPALDVFPYWLTAVTGSHAEAQGTGGFIHLDVEEAKSDPDKARVYFPAYDLDKFRSAAELVMKLKQTSPATARPAPAAAMDADVPKCAKCGAVLPEYAVYCAQCGEQASEVCGYCGGRLASGAAYCHHCGSKAVQMQTSCPNCGARTMAPQSYCRECGSVLVTTCAGCGGRVLPDDKHCRYCGRLLGTDRVDLRAARALHERVTAARRAVEPRHEEEASASVSEAEQHNQLGQKLFEEENTSAAIEEFRAAVALEPDNASYHCNLAVAYDEDDQDEAALAEYEKTLELAPNDLTALLSLGYLYNENDAPERATEVWNKVIEIAPLSAEAQEAQDNLRHQGQL